MGGVYYTHSEDYLVYHAFATTTAAWYFRGATGYDSAATAASFTAKTVVNVDGPSGNVTRDVFVGVRRMGDGQSAVGYYFYQIFIVWGTHEHLRIVWVWVGVFCFPPCCGVRLV